MDAAIDLVTSRKHGLVSHSQALDLGLTPAAIRHRVRSRSWRRVRTGLYAVRGVPASWHQDVLGAVLVGGEPAWASHGSAARLWGLPGFDDAPIEITTPLERRVRLPGIRAHRTGTLTDDDVGERDGVPTTHCDGG